MQVKKTFGDEEKTKSNLDVHKRTMAGSSALLGFFTFSVLFAGVAYYLIEYPPSPSPTPPSPTPAPGPATTTAAYTTTAGTSPTQTAPMPGATCFWSSGGNSNALQTYDNTLPTYDFGTLTVTSNTCTNQPTWWCGFDTNPVGWTITSCVFGNYTPITQCMSGTSSAWGDTVYAGGFQVAPSFRNKYAYSVSHNVHSLIRHLKVN